MGDQNTTRLPMSREGRTKVIVGVVLAAAVIAGAAGLVLRTRITAKAATHATVATERVLIGIEGMRCTSCASGIRSMLKRTRGVVSADVSFNQKEVNVEFDPSATSREKIIEVINNMGYKARVKG